MKTKQYQLSCLKKQLKRKQRNQVKFLIWKLSKEQIEYIEQVFGLKVEPYLYEIRTQSFKNIRCLNSSILKDIHYRNKRDKKTEVRRLNQKEKHILDDYGIRYRPYKYKINLF